MQHRHCATHLLQLGARANSGDLINAAKIKSPKLVTGILLAGRKVEEERDKNGKSAQELALEGGCVEIINLITPGALTPKRNPREALVAEFLKGNVKWSPRTHFGESVLEAAIQTCDKAFLPQVVRKHLKVYDPGALCAAVFLADEYGFGDLSVVKMLFKKRDPATRSNVREGTAIALAAVMRNLRCVDMLDYIPVVKYGLLPYESKHAALIDDTAAMYWDGGIIWTPSPGRSFWHRDRNLRTSPLFFAIQGGYMDVIYKLLDAGFVPNTLTMLAAITSRQEAVVKTATVMIQHGACIQGRIPGMLTPLQAAVMKENMELVEILLDKNADVNARPGGLRSPTWRYESWPPRTALQMAVEKGNLPLIRRLLDSGAHINVKASDEKGGATALQLAAIQGFLGIVKMLLDNGADVNARRCQSFGRTALEGASEHGRLDTVQLLLTHGVKIEGKGRRQYIRAVKFARKMGHTAIERLLISQRPWEQEEMEMLEEEELDEVGFYDSEEWSDGEEAYGGSGRWYQQSRY